MAAEFEGYNDILRRLNELESESTQIIDDALQAGAKIIAKEASRKAPRSRKIKQHLADHIVVGDIKNKDNIRTIEIGLEGGSQNGRYFYGRFQERGTKKMNPHPFLEPALSSTADEVKQVMLDEIRRGLGL